MKNLNIYMSILLSLSLTSLSSAASYFSLEGQTIEQSLITGSCHEIKTEVTKLNLFNKRYYPDSTCKLENIKQIDDNLCSFNLSHCIPEVLGKKVGTSFAQDGPNCYGTSLYTTKNYSHLRFVSEKEFSAVVNSPYCKKVDNPSPGDLGVFKAPAHEYLHAFTYLSPNLIFEKMGADDKLNQLVFPFILSHSVNTFYKWEASPECRRYGYGSKECYNEYFYMTCDLNEFYNAIPTQLKQSLLFLSSEIERVSKKTSIEIHRLNEKISLQILVNKLKKDIPNYKLNKFDLNIISGQLGSIQDQINAIESVKKTLNTNLIK